MASDVLVVGDEAIEVSAEGTDTVNARVTWTLATGLENLVLLGLAAIDGAGNDASNLLQGNGANNRLEGRNGNDTLLAGKGDDLLLGGDGADQLNGSIGNDTLTGGLGQDLMTGHRNNEKMQKQVCAIARRACQRARARTKWWGRGGERLPVRSAASGPHPLRSSVPSIPCDLDETMQPECAISTVTKTGYGI